MTILSSRRANINLNSGGGDKKQGLAPKSTFFFKAPFTGRQYSTDSGDGSNRFKLVCMNQLGGIGRGRSQFGTSADGTNCDKDDINPLIRITQFIIEIQQTIQNQIQGFLDGSAALVPYNSGVSFELVLVGEKENFLSDIFNSDSNNLIHQGVTFMNSNEGHDISGNIFTHLLSNDLSYNVSFITDGSGVKNIQHNFQLDLYTILQIKYVNYFLPDYPPFYLQSNTVFGKHTLGILNNNFVIDVSSNPDASFNNSSPGTLLTADGYGPYVPDIGIRAFERTDLSLNPESYELFPSGGVTHIYFPKEILFYLEGYHHFGNSVTFIFPFGDEPEFIVTFGEWWHDIPSSGNILFQSFKEHIIRRCKSQCPQLETSTLFNEWASSRLIENDQVTWDGNTLTNVSGDQIHQPVTLKLPTSGSPTFDAYDFYRRDNWGGAREDVYLNLLNLAVPTEINDILKSQRMVKNMDLANVCRRYVAMLRPSTTDWMEEMVRLDGGD